MKIGAVGGMFELGGGGGGDVKNSEAQEGLGMLIHSFKYVHRHRKIEFHSFVLFTHYSLLMYQSGNTLC